MQSLTPIMRPGVLVEKDNVSFCIGRDCLLTTVTVFENLAWCFFVPKSTECYRDVNLIPCFGVFHEWEFSWWGFVCVRTRHGKVYIN